MVYQHLDEGVEVPDTRFPASKPLVLDVMTHPKQRGCGRWFWCELDKHRSFWMTGHYPFVGVSKGGYRTVRHVVSTVCKSGRGQRTLETTLDRRQVQPRPYVTVAFRKGVDSFVVSFGVDGADRHSTPDKATV
jgi:hypothetical protein